jgi:hypothetical protein
MNSQNHHICVMVKYLPCTNTKPSRLSFYLPRWKKRVVSSTHALDGRDNAERATHWLSKKGITPSGFGEGENSTISFLIPWDQLPAVLPAFGLK